MPREGRPRARAAAHSREAAALGAGLGWPALGYPGTPVLGARAPQDGAPRSVSQLQQLPEHQSLPAAVKTWAVAAVRSVFLSRFNTCPPNNLLSPFRWFLSPAPDFQRFCTCLCRVAAQLLGRGRALAGSQRGWNPNHRALPPAFSPAAVRVEHRRDSHCMGAGCGRGTPSDPIRERWVSETLGRDCVPSGTALEEGTEGGLVYCGKGGCSWWPQGCPQAAR